MTNAFEDLLEVSKFIIVAIYTQTIHKLNQRLTRGEPSLHKSLLEVKLHNSISAGSLLPTAFGRSIWHTRFARLLVLILIAKIVQCIDVRVKKHPRPTLRQMDIFGRLAWLSHDVNVKTRPRAGSKKGADMSLWF